MPARYVLAPQAAFDLVEIWRYIKEHASVGVADRIESTVLERIALLADAPGAGHQRKDLTEENVRFFPVYSYLIVYRSEARPLQIIAIVHGRRNVEEILKERL